MDKTIIWQSPHMLAIIVCIVNIARANATNMTMASNDNSTMMMPHSEDHGIGGDDQDHAMDHGTDNGMDKGSGHKSGHGVFFQFSNDVTLIFKEWTTNTETFIPSCVGAALLAAFYEGFKIFREYLIMKTKSGESMKSGCCNPYCTCMHLLQTILHIIQVAVSYALMLLFMTFNIWLCISILLGAGFGYLVFGWTVFTRHAVSRFDHCH